MEFKELKKLVKEEQAKVPEKTFEINGVKHTESELKTKIKEIHEEAQRQYLPLTFNGNQYTVADIKGLIQQTVKEYCQGQEVEGTGLNYQEVKKLLRAKAGAGKTLIHFDARDNKVKVEVEIMN